MQELGNSLLKFPEAFLLQEYKNLYVRGSSNRKFGEDNLLFADIHSQKKKKEIIVTCQFRLSTYKTDKLQNETRAGKGLINAVHAVLYS